MKNQQRFTIVTGDAYDIDKTFHEIPRYMSWYSIIMLLVWKVDALSYCQIVILSCFPEGCLDYFFEQGWN